jgi:hypothetical protein
MILKDDDLQGIIGVAVIDTYINHQLPDDQMSDIDIDWHGAC